MERLLLRVVEAAEAMGISRSACYELIARGEVPSIKLGHSIRVPAEYLKTWIDEQMQTRQAGGVWRPSASSTRRAAE